ncbi:MAG TPA: LytR C-terminal domain-containing protein [Mycobacteriales bacterium]|nr:LytR C-terminal domain-containing protein [Mycobacteriales bacterium]
MIVAGIVVLNLLQRGPDVGDVQQVAAARASASAVAAAKKPPAKPGKAATGKPTAKAKAKANAKPKPKPAATAKPAATPKPAAKTPTKPAAPAADPTSKPAADAATVRAARQPLTVLNSSRIRGLAAGAADDFTGRGWSISFVGNTTYRARVTTAYYAPGQDGAARRLMAEFPAVQRMLPRPSGLPGRGLTVVVTREYAG